MNFLFWNVRQNALEEEIALLLVEHQTDIAVFAEYPGDSAPLLQGLSNEGVGYSAIQAVGVPGLLLLTRFELRDFQFRFESSRYLILEFLRTGFERFLLIAVHLHSKLYKNDNDQKSDARCFRQDVEMHEELAGTRNTIILGDFNMNPFDLGMIDADALHALPCLRTAKAGQRIVAGRPYSFFYNPCWALLGDRHGVAGTHYYRDGGYTSYEWNVLDQVLVRPSIADKLDKQSVQILESAGGRPLIGENGRPSLSDHLPINFTVAIENAS